MMSPKDSELSDAAKKLLESDSSGHSTDSILERMALEDTVSLLHVHREEERRSANFGGLKTLRRKDAQFMQSSSFTDSLFYDTSSRSVYSLLSPFTRGSSPIPVPGSDAFSLTVEGIWQGLKLINGRIDEDLFEKDRVTKRKSQDYHLTNFQYGAEIIDLVEARKTIFLPSYFYMLDNCIPQQFTDNIIRAHKGGIDQFFYDVDDNFDITNASSSYSHSDAIIKWLRHKMVTEWDLKLIVAESNPESFNYHLPPRAHHFISKSFEVIEGEPEVRDKMFKAIDDYLGVTGYQTRLSLNELFQKTRHFSKYKTKKKEILKNLVPEPFL